MSSKVLDPGANWERSTSGIWKGKNNTFYRLGKDGSLFSSSDLKNWEVNTEGWRDINSRWIKLIDGKLLWSNNKLDWMPLDKQYWQSPGSVLYRFDEEFNLYSKPAKYFGLTDLQN